MQTLAFAGLLAAGGLAAGAATKGDLATDITGPMSTSSAPAEDQSAGPPAAAPPSPAAASSAAPAADSSDEDTDLGSETATSGPKASSAPAAKPVEPDKRPRYAVAVLQALDKVTAETIRFEAPIDKPIRYKTLIFTVHACETTAPDEPRPDAMAHLEIDSQPLPVPGRLPPGARRVFLGWMFASSPGLDLFQHPVYDAWLVACKTALPST